MEWGSSIAAEPLQGSYHCLAHQQTGTGRTSRVYRARFEMLLIVEQGDELERFWELLDSSGDLDENEPQAGHLQFVDLYRVFPKLAPDLDSHIVGSRKLRKNLLVTDGIYILDVGTEISLWVGKGAWPMIRSISTDLFTASHFDLIVDDSS